MRRLWPSVSNSALGLFCAHSLSMRSLSHTIGSVAIGVMLSTGLLACSSFSPDEPPLPDSTMVEVLTELQLAEARARTYGDVDFAVLRDSVLLHYGVSDARFESALHYYSERPSAYLPIHTAVEDSLETGRRRLMQGN